MKNEKASNKLQSISPDPCDSHSQPTTKMKMIELALSKIENYTYFFNIIYHGMQSKASQIILIFYSLFFYQIWLMFLCLILLSTMFGGCVQ